MEVDKIYKRFHQLLYTYIAARVNDKDDAADILQEVFIKISSKLDTLVNNEKLKSWIFTITRNAIIDYYRSQAKGKSADLTDKIINEAAEQTEFDATLGLEKCLKGFIQKLPGEYREIIIDSELKGIKQKDLAVKYNLAYSSVRSRVQRGRIRLKEMLTTCCKVELDRRGNILETTAQNSCGSTCENCD